MKPAINVVKRLQIIRRMYRSLYPWSWLSHWYRWRWDGSCPFSPAQYRLPRCQPKPITEICP